MLKENRVCGKSNGNLDMTAISVFYDAGVNPLRKTATLKAVQHWMMQSHLPDEFLFLELGFDGVFTFTQADFPEQIHYIRIDGTERNKYLFQKEHLWNMAAKMATHEKLMFIDSDVAPIDDQDWFRKVYGTLDKCLFTQGFETCHYMDENNNCFFSKPSYTYAISNFISPKVSSHLSGLVYCLQKTLLENMGYFNFLPFGGGDTLFWDEMSVDGNAPDHQRLIVNITSRRKSLNLKISFGNVEVDVCHFYHGKFINRSYAQRDYLLLTQFPWNNRIVIDGKNGLLQWVDLSCWFHDVMSKFHTINDNKFKARDLVNGHQIDYLKFIEKIDELPYDAENLSDEIQLAIRQCSIQKTIQKNQLLKMSAVSVFYDDGVNPLRRTATLQAVDFWVKQSHIPEEILFIELGFDGIFTFSQEDFPPQIIYIRLDGTASHKYLFQKEYLWNIGAKMASNQKLMFIDSDISPISNIDWFKKIYDALDRCIFTQGFDVITYLDKNGTSTGLSKLSYTKLFLNNIQCHGRYGVPGGAFCIDKQFLQLIGWFNTIAFGAGDILLWSELFGLRRPNDFLVQMSIRPKVKATMDVYSRYMNKKQMCSISANVYHFYHGKFINRSYEQRNFLWATQYPWMNRILCLDDNGLIKWIDISHWFYNVMSKFHTINDNKFKARDLMKGHIDYIGFLNEIDNYNCDLGESSLMAIIKNYTLPIGGIK